MEPRSATRSNRDYTVVDDIFSVPCATRCNGQKAIKVHGNFAYVQYVDGMRIYKRSDLSEVWECVKEIHMVNC